MVEVVEVVVEEEMTVGLVSGDPSGDGSRGPGGECGLQHRGRGGRVSGDPGQHGWSGGQAREVWVLAA